MYYHPLSLSSNPTTRAAGSSTTQSCLSLQSGHYSSLTAPNLQTTANQERNEQWDNKHYSRELLIMGIIVPETCWAYTGCPRRNVRDFGRVFLMFNYTDITQNTYVQSRTVMEIMAREKCGCHGCRNTIHRPWHHTCPLPLPDQRDMVMQWPWRVRYSAR